MLKKLNVISYSIALSMVIIGSLFPGLSLFAHGSMKDPISRIYDCYLQNPETPDTLACVEAVRAGGTQPLYDWNEINQGNAGGNHKALIPDGQLCAGGREKYAFFDDPRNDWAITQLPESGSYTFLYEAYVPHNQGYFEFFVTKDEYDFSAPLKWSDLESPAFARVERPPVVKGSYVMDVQLPAGKNGRHVIYVIWQRYDSQEAFYSCSDVWFGNNIQVTHPTAPSCDYPSWDSSLSYEAGDLVTHDGKLWKAKWVNRYSQPGTEGGTNPWEFNGKCPEAGHQPTPIPDKNKLGDVNSDDVINIIDALLISQHYVGITNKTFKPDLADVNCSGSIDIIDALLISQFYVGLTTLVCP